MATRDFKIPYKRQIRLDAVAALTVDQGEKRKDCASFCGTPTFNQNSCALEGEKPELVL